MTPAPTPPEPAPAARPSAPAHQPAPARQPAEDPGAALSSLADAAVAEYRREAQNEPDPRVGTAFALGWQISEIYRPDPAPPLPSGESNHLPALSDLAADERAQIGLSQVEAGVTKLSRRIAAANLAVPDAPAFARRLQGLTGAQRDAVVQAFHTELLGTLVAADFRLGKAYGVGRALADATRNLPGSDWRSDLSEANAAILATALRELSTALPAHAARSVACSLGEWGRWAARPARDAARASLDQDELLAQGRLWRSFVSGEKRPTDTLEMSDYVRSGESMVHGTAQLAKPVIKHLAPLIILVVGLFVAGVVVMLVSNDAAGIVSGAGVILTGLGLGWKGIGTRVGTAIAKLETPLWESALDHMICDRITPQRVLDELGPRPHSPDEPSLVAAARAAAQAGGPAPT